MWTSLCFLRYVGTLQGVKKKKIAVSYSGLYWKSERKRLCYCPLLIQLCKRICLHSVEHCWTLNTLLNTGDNSFQLLISAPRFISKTIILLNRKSNSTRTYMNIPFNHWTPSYLWLLKVGPSLSPCLSIYSKSEQSSTEPAQTTLKWCCCLEPLISQVFYMLFNLL